MEFIGREQGRERTRARSENTSPRTSRERRTGGWSSQALQRHSLNDTVLVLMYLVQPLATAVPCFTTRSLPPYCSTTLFATAVLVLPLYCCTLFN